MKKPKWHIRVFRYIENIWLGSDGKLSIRRLLALVFSIDFVRNTQHAVFNWDSEYSYADAAMLLGIEAGLIAALLSLTTYSGVKHRRNGWGRHRRYGGEDINVDVDVNIDDAIDEEINRQKDG